MKLGEILNRSNVEYRPATEQDILATSEYLLSGAELVSDLAGKFSLWKKSIPDFAHFYFIKAQEAVAGWIGLKPRKLHSTDVYAIDLIFFAVPFRHTKAVPLFLHSLRAQLDRPLMIDASDAIFKGGAELLTAMVRRGAVSMTAVSPDGTRKTVSSLDGIERNDAILIEDVSPVIVPSKNLLGQQDGFHLIDWIDNQDEFI